MQAWITDFLRYFEAQRGASPLTCKHYAISLKAAALFFAALGEELTWSSLQTPHVRLWMAKMMEEGSSAAKINRAMSALRSFYKFLQREGRVERNPTQLVRNPKKSKRLPSFVKDSEMSRLFADFPFADSYEGERDRTLLLLLYHTGLRAAEVLRLRVRDVQLHPAQLSVTGKGNKQRLVPFGAELVQQLESYLQRRRAHLEALASSQKPIVITEQLFLQRSGRALSYAQLNTLVKQHLSAVTTQRKRTPHVLRHSFATAMLTGGAQLEAIKQLLGHESVATTAIYTHTTITELQAQYAAAHPHAQRSHSPHRSAAQPTDRPTAENNPLPEATTPTEAPLTQQIKE